MIQISKQHESLKVLVEDTLVFGGVETNTSHLHEADPELHAVRSTSDDDLDFFIHLSDLSNCINYLNSLNVLDHVVSRHYPDVIL